MSARDFLDSVAGYLDPKNSSGAPSTADRPIMLGVVDPSYSGTGAAKVTFEGEGTMSGQLFVTLQPIAASDRVALLPVGRTYVILGKLGVGAWYTALTDADTALGVGYRLNQVVKFTANGAFTKATYPWLRAIRVRAVGGGGAGGGAAATGSGVYSIGAGGGGGGYAEAFITDIAGLASSVTVTRGAGGTAVSGGTGNAGASSSFGALVVAKAGSGGGVKPANVFAPYISAPAGGVGTAGDLLLAGQGGTTGAGYADLGSSGSGGSSQLGGGAPGVGSGSTGAAGVVGGDYGGGGSGAMNSSSQGARSGGAGAPGVVIVELFA